MRKALFLLGFVGCRSCGWDEGEKTFESLDGPTKVELVRETHWGGGEFGAAPVSHFVIRVHTNPPFDEPTTCTRAQFAENDRGNLIAFRCDSSDTWKIIRVGHANRHFFECSTVLDAKKPDLSKAHLLADAAPVIVQCNDTPGAKNWQELYASLALELRDEGGSVSRFLADTAESPGIEGWIAVVPSLSAPERADLEKRLCPSLLAESAPRAYERAARVCPLDRTDVADAALLRVKRTLSSPPPEEDASFDWALLAALGSHASDVGDAVCAAANPNDQALAALAASKVKCASVASLLENACGESQCGDHTCKPSELAGEIDAWRAAAAPISMERARCQRYQKPPKACFLRPTRKARSPPISCCAPHASRTRSTKRTLHAAIESTRERRARARPIRRRIKSARFRSTAASRISRAIARSRRTTKRKSFARVTCAPLRARRALWTTIVVPASIVRERTPDRAARASVQRSKAPRVSLECAGFLRCCSPHRHTRQLLWAGPSSPTAHKDHAL